MKSEVSSKSVFGSGKEEAKKTRQSMTNPPQLNIDPEKRRDFFNRLLEKYSTKSTKICNPSSGASFGQRSARFPSVPPTKTTNKMKDKFLKKKKSSSDKCIVKSSNTDEASVLEPVETWKKSIKNHAYDTSVYKNHIRIKTRFPFPLSTIDESVEPPNTSEDSDTEETKSGDTTAYESVNHSFTFLPCSGKNHGGKKDIEIKYKKKFFDRENPLPEELQPRHLTRTSSGTLVWVGNNTFNNLIQKKNSKKSDSKDANEDAKLSQDFRSMEDIKSSGEGEERLSSKTENKPRRCKMKKNTSQELEDGAKPTKPISQDAKSHQSKPSSSSLPHLPDCLLLNALQKQSQEEGKTTKKINDKIKKPKKLTKKQTFTLVTSKPPT